MQVTSELAHVSAMPEFELFKQGAEAKLLRGRYLNRPAVLKERFPKRYRHAELDERLSKERVRAECRALVKCLSLGIAVPTVYHVDLERRTIIMEYLESNVTVRDFIITYSEDELQLIEQCARVIGEVVAQLHSNWIVHGDLTTSNLILVHRSGSNLSALVDAGPINFDDVELKIIDFGLASLCGTPEDCAVDLYVLQRAIESTHSIVDNLFDMVMVGYRKDCKNAKAILAKLEQVRARGRKRTMVG